MPSTAVCTTISSRPTRSRLLVNDSPTRRIASCSRARSRCSSSRRSSSCTAIELNSLPSAANSSLPSAGTRWEKSPRPIARAACSRRWISDSSVRVTVIAKAMARSRKPISAPTTSQDGVSSWLSSRSAIRICRSPPSKPSTVSVLTRYGWPSISVEPLLGSVTRANSGREAACDLSPSRITTPTSAMSSSFMAKLDDVSTAVTRRPSGFPSWSVSELRAGATPGSVPYWNAPGPSRSSSTRFAPALREASASRAVIASGSLSAIARRSPSSATISPPAASARVHGVADTGSGRRAAPRSAGRHFGSAPSVRRAGTARTPPRSWAGSRSRRRTAAGGCGSSA